MEALFSEQYKWLWVGAMTLALFPFVRKLIWVMAVRKHMRKGGVDQVPESEQGRLKKRAAFTSALLCLLFSLAYINILFKS